MEVQPRDKTAIITGAASGIGLATAVKYLEAGAAGVVAVDIARELPDVLARQAPEAGGRLRCVCGDVGVEQTAADFTRAALDAFGRITPAPEEVCP